MAGSNKRLYERDGEIKLDIVLTNKGVQNYERVISVVFAFINKIKEQGP